MSRNALRHGGRSAAAVAQRAEIWAILRLLREDAEAERRAIDADLDRIDAVG